MLDRIFNSTFFLKKIKKIKIKKYNDIGRVKVARPKKIEEIIKYLFL